MSLRRFDLNLLPVFDVLIEERNITRSAQRLAMSQPAVSHALSRLRQQLNDPLLVRSGDGMQPSPRALQIHQELQTSLNSIERTLSPQPHFEAINTERQFSIATTDYVEALILPPLLTRLQKDAPGIRLQIRHLASHLPLDDIENGSIDLAIGRAENIPKRFRTLRLLEDDYLCAMSAHHELAGEKMTMARFSRQEHLLVAPEAKRKELAKDLFPGQSVKPKIIANLPHFLAALHAASASAFIVTGPARLLRKFQKPFNLALSKPPFELEPFQIFLVWHQLKATDQGLTWLRQQLEHISQQQADSRPD
ncbi:MAG: LysR family transcriptional regulator [Pseudomonadales bacterium]|nr:LysR family transcriptional regulator [Pseudomonadales bacterium]